MGTTAEVLRGAKDSERWTGQCWRTELGREGIRHSGIKLGSLIFPVAFLQRRAGAVNVNPAKKMQVRVRAS